jgi:hypothetical protein
MDISFAVIVLFFLIISNTVSFTVSFLIFTVSFIGSFTSSFSVFTGSFLITKYLFLMNNFPLKANCKMI